MCIRPSTSFKGFDTVKAYKIFLFSNLGLTLNVVTAPRMESVTYEK